MCAPKAQTGNGQPEPGQSEHDQPKNGQSKNDQPQNRQPHHRPDYAQLVSDNYRRLSNGLPNFRPRREQNYLVAEMAKVLKGQYDDQRRILVAEAGTGIGKSLAYLQAGIPWARLQQKKLVISTATLALQEQLVDKDLPLFAPHCKPRFSYALAKGRGRYCCAKRLADLASGEAQYSLLEGPLLSTALTDAQQAQLARLWQAFINKEWQGDRDSWPEPIAHTLWQHLQAERHSCQLALGHQHCPFHVARAELDEVDVIVVNHALLLADLKMGGGIVLPEPEQCLYIIDEAHHLATVARDQGAARLSLRQLRRHLEQLNKSAGKLNDLLGQAGQSALERMQAALHALLPSLQKLYQHLMHALHHQTLELNQHCARFSPGALPLGLDESLAHIKEEAKTVLRALGPLQSQLGELLKKAGTTAPAIEAALAQLSQQQGLLEQLDEGCQLLLTATLPKQTPPARWLEVDEQEIILCATPLAVGHLLEQWCWSRAAAVMMVSATLTALNDFAYFRRSVGLRPDDGSHYLRLKSPFNYQAATLIVPDLDCEPSSEQFNDTLVAQLPLWLAKQSASLVLFSSYQQMNQVAEQLRAQGQSLLVQGEASRQALLQLHKQKCDGQQPSVLFGTGSFAEGLDLPGPYLTNLIITKLPFAVPTSPVEAAMAEWITLCGGNPFMQLTLPEASRKLIQACGRLLRSETDHGRIVLLDNRVLHRRYGPALLNALPPFSRESH